MLGQRAVHLGRMPAVEVNRVRVRALVQEVDADPVPSVARRVGPGTWPLNVHAGRRRRRDLDLPIDRDEVVFPQQVPSGLGVSR